MEEKTGIQCSFTVGFVCFVIILAEV